MCPSSGRRCPDCPGILPFNACVLGVHRLTSPPVGQQLRSSLIKDFYYYYISYDELKDALKTGPESVPRPDNPTPAPRPWSEEDEQAFVTLLEAELDKV